MDCTWAFAPVCASVCARDSPSCVCLTIRSEIVGTSIETIHAGTLSGVEFVGESGHEVGLRNMSSLVTVAPGWLAGAVVCGHHIHVQHTALHAIDPHFLAGVQRRSTYGCVWLCVAVWLGVMLLVCRR